MFLVELNDGDFGKIEKLPEGIAGERLFEHGICEGVEFEKISGSPLGNIVTLGINERYFAVTNDIAEKIEVSRHIIFKDTEK